LRFRFHGRLRTVYVGRDQQRIQEVSAELESLRYRVRFGRQAERLAKAGRRTLRAAKRRVATALQELGYYYHGDAIRKSRVTPKDVA
jgi:hypothetical protein